MANRRKCPETGDALVEVRCRATNDRVTLRVPWEHRFDPVTWDDDEVVEWDSPTGKAHAVQVAKGERGITAVGPDGTVYKIDHGKHRSPKPARAVQRLEMGMVPLEKAQHADLKAGERWITVHPNGPDAKGVPVLISPNPDGTHSIIGGAGGALQHLRLKGVKSVEQHKADQHERDTAKAEAEKTRKAALSPEQRKQESTSKAVIKDAKHQAERKLVEHVRKVAGGVSEDKDVAELAGVSEDAKARALKGHHRMQVKEAKQRVRELLKSEAKAGVVYARESAQLHQDLDGDHFVDPGTRHLIEQELELQTADEEERRAERLSKKGGHQPAKRGEAARVAAEQMAPEIAEAPIDLHRFVKAGGHELDTESMRKDALPSEAQWRDATQLQVDAKVLVDAAQGKAADDPLSQAVLDKTRRDLGLADTESPEAKQRLLLEASRRFRRGELGLVKAAKFRELEQEGDDGYDKAQKAYAYGVRTRRIAEELKDARRQGLLETSQTPATEPELAAYDELLGHAQGLRKADKEWKSLTKRVEEGDYDAAREAFDVQHEEAPSDVTASVEDEIRAELARGIRGMADRKRPEFLAAHSAGVHDALSDVGLSIGKQAYTDRLVVDALGPKHAAVINRWALERDGHDPKAIQEALERNQSKEANESAAAAMQRADSFVPGFSATVNDVGDLETAQAQLHARDSDMAVAQRAVGAALGRLEALATLGQTFRNPMPTHLEVPYEGGDAGLERTLTHLGSIGLTQSGRDFTIDRTSGKVVIPQASWHKLVQRTPAEEIERRNKVDDIKRGDHDEKGWLPKGFVSRPETTFSRPPPTQPRYFEPLKMEGRDVQGAVRDHLGSRLLDGEHPADIQSDMLSPAAMSSVPENQKTQFVNAVKEAFPIVNDKGERRKFEEFSGHFDKVAEDFAKERYGAATGVHGQSVDLEDPKVQEAVYRTIAQHPETKHAYMPTGAMGDQDRRVLRRYLHQRLGIDPKEHTPEARMGREVAELGEKPKAQSGLFGGASAEVSDWEAKRDKVLARFPTASADQAVQVMGQSKQPQKWLENHLANVFGPLPDGAKVPTDEAGRAELLKSLGTPGKQDEALEKLFPDERHRGIAAGMLRDHSRTPWQKFVKVHGSQELAYTALQDELKGKFAEAFQEHYGKVTGKPVQKGIQEITNMERHLRATDPEKADEHLEKLRGEYSAVQERGAGGKYQEMGGQGALLAEHGKWLEQSTIAAQNQIGMFGAKKAPEQKAPELRSTLKPGERFTLGRRLEQQIASVAPHLGAPFEAGKPVQLFAGANMDGARVDQQRVIKQMKENGGRIAVLMGTGAGKTPMAIGAFTDHHAEGKATHAVFAVPSAVQEQFGSEIAAFTEPGKYRFQTGAGKSHNERVAMLKDQSTHMKVMTHESFRDTAVQLMADHFREGDSAKMAEDLHKADATTRAHWLREAFDKAGIPPYFFAGDEAHRFTTGAGPGSESLLHLVMSAASHPVNATQAMFGTATPVKNNAEEAWSMAAMVHPDKFGSRDKFARNYGSDFAMNPTAIRREMAPYSYTAKIPPQGVDRIDTDNPELVGSGPEATKKAGGPIKLHPEHQKKVDHVQALYDRVVKARGAGGVDVDAMKELSPDGWDGLDEGASRARAAELAQSVGIIKETAMRKAINLEPYETNTKLQRMVGIVKHDLDHGTWKDRKGVDHKGKPAVIFSNSAAECEHIHTTLQAQGVKSAYYHGGLDSKARSKIVRGFQGGDYGAIVLTPAGEAGIGLQNGKVSHNFDVPYTEKAWNQRNGRAYRQGQQGNVDVHNYHTDTDYDRNALRRLKEKSVLAEVWQNPVERLDEKGIAGEYQKVLAERHQDHDITGAVA